jgi:hypothetical protein
VTGEAVSTARIYDYLLGGTNNTAADRQAADQLLLALPDAGVVAKANRAFMAEAVRQVAANGVTQFVDIGPSFPTRPNVHESARSVAPGARVAYVDHDPEVVTHTRELLAGDDLVTAFIGDAADIEGILANPELTSLIDLAEPICVLFVSVLHFVPPAQADAAVATIRDRIAPGSYLVISAGLNNEQNEPAQGLVQAAYSARTTLAGRPKAEVAAYFGDFELLPPGLVHVADWPNDRTSRSETLQMADMLAGVARKPA